MHFAASATISTTGSQLSTLLKSRINVALPTPRKWSVAFDEPRDRGAATQVDHLTNNFVAAGREDAATARCKRLHGAVALADNTDLAGVRHRLGCLGL